jgi:predicted ester cyclase
MGIPASNNAVEIRGVDFFRLENDRIKEIWVSLDSFGLMQQLGAIASQ